MYAMTAAHPTLPIPSYAQVTHLRNGRQVVVRVNDRGPFLHGRVIDLSWTAASRLGYVQAGSAEVEVVLIHDPIAFARNRESDVPAQAGPAAPVQVVQVAVAPAGGAAASDPARPQPLALETQSVDRQAPAALVPGIWLQMGAFSQAERAQVARDRGAAALGLPADRLVVQPASGLWRLLAGPYGSRGEAMAAAERVRQATDLAPIPITVGP
jgi:rare lipoprotein A